MTSRITLTLANTIIAAAFAKGKELNLKPLSVVVVDAGGHVQAFQRADGASSMRLGIALGKAAGALALGVSSRKIGEMAVERPAFVTALAGIPPHGLVPAAGGVIVKGDDGFAIGAVGVTGDTSDNDEVCTLAGIAAAGLTPAWGGSVNEALAARYGAEMPPPGVWNDTLDLLLAHRSVRAYLPEPLPVGALEAAIAAAQSASTSSNLQLWSVIAVEDGGRRARLAALAGGQEHVARAPLLLVWLADLGRLRHLGEMLGEVTEGLDYFEAFLLSATDAALAAQNAMTALESLGLGCCYIGGIRNDAPQVAAELGLPDHVFALFGMTIGVPDPARPAHVKPRLPQDVVLMREQYEWSAVQRDAIDAYNERLRAFQRATKMKEQDWTALVTRRVRDAQALTGRHILRDFLNKIGFKLR